MRLVEGIVRIGGTADGETHEPDDAPDGRVFSDVDAFVAALEDIGDRHGVTVQAFDARYVVSRRHLERAMALADRERARGDGIARDRAVEVLLYAAGRRQIDRALELGIGKDETPAVVLVDDPDDRSSAPAAAEDGVDVERAGAAAEDDAAEAVRELLAPTATLGEYDESLVREFYDIGEAELAATSAPLEELVLERVTLLVVER